MAGVMKAGGLPVPSLEEFPYEFEHNGVEYYSSTEWIKVPVPGGGIKILQAKKRQTLAEFLASAIGEELEKINADFPAHYMATVEKIGNCNENCYPCRLEKQMD